MLGGRWLGYWYESESCEGVGLTELSSEEVGYSVSGIAWLLSAYLVISIRSILSCWTGRM